MRARKTPRTYYNVLNKIINKKCKNEIRGDVVTSI